MTTPCADMSATYSPSVLTGGRWVNVRGVQRWVADPKPEPAKAEAQVPIACDHCGARMDEHCRNPRGDTYYRGHAVRLNDAPGRRRLCQCGTPLGPRRKHCDACWINVRRQTWREASRRKRARAAEVIDEVAIQRRMNGDKRVRLAKAERDELVARWLSSGRTASELSQVTGIRADRHVERGEQVAS